MWSLQTHLGLLFCPGVLQCDRAVEDRVLRGAVIVRCEISASHELQVIAGFGICEPRLELCVLQDNEGIRIEVVQVVACLSAGVLGCKELVVESDLSVDGMSCADPVACSLDLSSVRSLSSAGLGVIGAVNDCDLSVGILLAACGLDVVGCLQSDLVSDVESVISLGRNLHEVLALDVELFAEGHLALSGGLVLGVVLDLEVLDFVLGVVVDDELDRVKDGHDALCTLVEVLADAELHEGVVHYGLDLGHADTGDEILHGFRRVSAASDSADGGHSGIVPSAHDSQLDQVQELALAHDKIVDVQSCELVLMRCVVYAVD